MKYRFTNDYSEIAHPRILQRLLECQHEQNIGYGINPTVFAGVPPVGAGDRHLDLSDHRPLPSGGDPMRIPFRHRMLVVVFAARFGGRGLVDLGRQHPLLHPTRSLLLLLVLDHQGDF